MSEEMYGVHPNVASNLDLSYDCPARESKTLAAEILDQIVGCRGNAGLLLCGVLGTDQSVWRG